MNNIIFFRIKVKLAENYDYTLVTMQCNISKKTLMNYIDFLANELFYRGIMNIRYENIIMNIMNIINIIDSNKL